MTYLASDILAQQEYFRQLVAKDDQLQTFLFEGGEDIEHFNEKSKAPDFQYPCLVLFMPMLEIDDPGYGNIDANQDNAFAILYMPTEDTDAARNEALQRGQLAAFRVIAQIRKDARSGIFRLPEERKWRVRPMSNVGPDKAHGSMVDFNIITNANAQVGFSD